MEIVQALQKADVEAVFLAVLVQLVVILLAARLGGMLARKVGQTAVVGEIVVGLILGPSLLGRIDFVHRLFHPEIGGVPPEMADQVFRWIFTILSQLGLVLLLFLVGLEFDFSHLRRNGTSAFLISIAGIALPFVLGIGLAPLLLACPDLGRHPQSASELPALGFTLFLGVALSITALPVLARIMIELGITRTRLGAITITGAAIDDAAGWILLATVAAIVRSRFEVGQTMVMVGSTLAFAGLILFVARPILRAWARASVESGRLSATSLALLLCGVFLCAIATSVMGIFAIFGAFLLGASLSQESQFRDAVVVKLSDFVTSFFLPIFFTYTGLRTNIGSLETGTLWLLCALVLAAAVVGKILGCGLAAWASGFTKREAGIVGIMMNTRGLMALVVINLGYDLGVIPPSVFCMLVLMALVTTLMTTPLVIYLMRGTELEAAILKSGFSAGR